ncbi:hypothetical protein BC827DRAFT_729340 [Russula dissimulans]|nr:hypothetical protein BC827DRAFT_729340 [Russula dissimulans]
MVVECAPATALTIWAAPVRLNHYTRIGPNILGQLHPSMIASCINLLVIIVDALSVGPTHLLRLNLQHLLRGRQPPRLTLSTSREHFIPPLIQLPPSQTRPRARSASFSSIPWSAFITQHATAFLPNSCRATTQIPLPPNIDPLAFPHAHLLHLGPKTNHRCHPRSLILLSNLKPRYPTTLTLTQNPHPPLRLKLPNAVPPAFPAFPLFPPVCQHSPVSPNRSSPILPRPKRHYHLLGQDLSLACLLSVSLLPRTLPPQLLQ